MTSSTQTCAPAACHTAAHGGSVCVVLIYPSGLLKAQLSPDCQAQPLACSWEHSAQSPLLLLSSRASCTQAGVPHLGALHLAYVCKVMMCGRLIEHRQAAPASAWMQLMTRLEVQGCDLPPGPRASRKLASHRCAHRLLLLELMHARMVASSSWRHDPPLQCLASGGAFKCQLLAGEISVRHPTARCTKPADSMPRRWLLVSSASLPLVIALSQGVGR